MAEATPERILFLLKTRAPLGAASLARELGITAMGVRQHLARLAAAGLVQHADERAAVGRPKRSWRLTAQGHARFPDSHAQVTVELIGAVRAVFGEKGLDRLIATRERETLERYRRALEPVRSPAARLRRLAKLRSVEGYMAECRSEGDGAFLLIENHCPICAAAQSCQGFCRSELALFRAVLPDLAVERTDHLLAGARRCAYRISAAPRTPKESTRRRPARRRGRRSASAAPSPAAGS
jgi:predicted ArsR family transcriptional regulator